MAQTQQIRPWLELQTLREKDGHTLTSLAKVCINPETGRPMSLGYLSDLESGKREPNPSITRRLAVALNVPLSVLEKDRRIEDAA